MKSRPRRRNADDQLRRLERIADATKAPDDIAAYWIACIRSGKPPKHTTVFNAFGTYPESRLIWTLYPVEYDTYASNLRPVHVERAIQDYSDPELVVVNYADRYTIVEGVKLLLRNYAQTP